MLWRCCDGLKEPAQDGGYSATASLLEHQEVLSSVFALTGRSAGQSPAGPPRGRRTAGGSRCSLVTRSLAPLGDGDWGSATTRNWSRKPSEP
jgi:hypothetical protein